MFVKKMSCRRFLTILKLPILMILSGWSIIVLALTPETSPTLFSSLLPATSVVSRLPKATLTAADQTKFLGFGRSIALSGDGNTALIGSDDNAAYIFKRNNSTWTQVQKITKPKNLHCNNNGSWFGWSAALSHDGSTAMIGASGIFVYYSGFIPIYLFYSCSELPVYIKKNDHWVLEKLLTTADMDTQALFGASLALSGNGNTAVIGAQLTQCAANTETCGGAYFFERGATGWELRKSFRSTKINDVQGGFFGDTTAISADGLSALVGARAGNSVWAFTRQANGWKQSQKISLPANQKAYAFGTALALSATGNRAIITAESASGPLNCKGDFSDCGAAFVYKRQASTWALETRFTANDAHDNNYFGESVALSADGKRAVIGTSNADCREGNCGAAYVFDWNGLAWLQRGRTTGPSAGLGGYDLGGNFGGSVVLTPDGLKMLVAARQENCPAGKECGAVYYYPLGKP